MTPDEVFFGESRDRDVGESRSLARARHLADALGLVQLGLPLLTVVGSKGKGTAATFASAYLTAVGWRVCMVTSPGLRSYRDRIRVNGRAIAEADLQSLAERIRQTMDVLPPRTSGYLSAAGLFLLAGLLHARDTGVDALVLEAGMGGQSDEVALFAPAIAAITPVFGEHLGILGDSPATIAAEKAGVVAPTTRVVIAAPQRPEIREVLDRTVAARTGDAVTVRYVGPGDSEVPADLLRSGLIRGNAEVGCVAAQCLLQVGGVPMPAADRLRGVLSSISLPGRMSWHRIPGSATEILADSAIDRIGFAAALAEARARWGGIDHALVCLPDDKDLDGAITELAGLPVTCIRLPLYKHLRFTRPLPSQWRLIDPAGLNSGLVAGLGRRVIALGAVRFIGLVLELVDADTEYLFTTAPIRRR